jgi:KaiC/GvpD/RAD55 family RecA-like ATPase
MLGPVIEIKSSERLKNKILEKIEQLLEGYLNLVVLNISHPWAHFENAEDAFNGAIDMEESKHVSAVVAFEDFDYENRKIYVNSQASILLTNELLEKI